MNQANILCCLKLRLKVSDLVREVGQNSLTISELKLDFINNIYQSLTSANANLITSWLSYISV
jgi:hypothetical protein